MRWIHSFSALGMLAMLISPAAGQGMAGSSGLKLNAYCAPACGAPSYGLAPGCCEYTRNCCSDVWAGYCNEPGRYFGTGQLCSQGARCRSCQGPAMPATGCGCTAVGGDQGPGETVVPAASARAAPAAPLTPAVGRRLPYTRPPVRFSHY
jgi:hypothetical protein